MKANNRVSQHYEVEPAYELGTVAETGQLDSRNGGHAGDPIQVIKQVTIKSQVNEFHEPGAATGGATGSSTALISTYRTESTTSQSKYPSKAKRPSPDQMKALRADVRKCEERMTKIDDMRDKLAKKLADPVLYEDARKGELETWNKKYAEVMEAHGRAEAMWMAALEKLDAAEK